MPVEPADGAKPAPSTGWRAQGRTSFGKGRSPGARDEVVRSTPAMRASPVVGRRSDAEISDFPHRPRRIPRLSRLATTPPSCRRQYSSASQELACTIAANTIIRTARDHSADRSMMRRIDIPDAGRSIESSGRPRPPTLPGRCGWAGLENELHQRSRTGDQERCRASTGGNDVSRRVHRRRTVGQLSSLELPIDCRRVPLRAVPVTRLYSSARP
jgi:hypothetical protein